MNIQTQVRRYVLSTAVLQEQLIECCCEPGEGPPPPELKIEAAPLEETAPEVLPEGAEPGAAPEQSRPAAVLPGKAALLERLRSRARKGAGQPPAGS